MVFQEYYFCLQQFLGTAKTGAHGGIEHGALGSYAKTGCRQQGILLGVDTNAKVVILPRFVFVPIHAAIATTVHAVHHIGGGAIITGRYNAIVQYQDSTDAIALAVGPGTHGHGNLHIVFVPAWALPLI